MIYHLEGCAKIMAANDRPAAALRCLSAAQQLRTSGGWVLPESEQASLQELVMFSAGGLTVAERAAALQAGRHDQLSDIIRQVLDDLHDFDAPESSGVEA